MMIGPTIRKSGEASEQKTYVTANARRRSMPVARVRSCLTEGGLRQRWQTLDTGQSSDPPLAPG